MSQIVIEDEGWKAIMADPQLWRARTKLSFHEIRMIVRHARQTTSGTHNSAQDAGGERNSASDMVGRVAQAINRARMDPCVSAQAVAALEASHHAEIVEWLQAISDLHGPAETAMELVQAGARNLLAKIGGDV